MIGPLQYGRAVDLISYDRRLVKSISDATLLGLTETSIEAVHNGRVINVSRSRFGLALHPLTVAAKPGGDEDHIGFAVESGGQATWDEIRYEYDGATSLNAVVPADDSRIVGDTCMLRLPGRVAAPVMLDMCGYRMAPKSDEDVPTDGSRRKTNRVESVSPARPSDARQLEFDPWAMPVEHIERQFEAPEPDGKTDGEDG